MNFYNEEMPLGQNLVFSNLKVFVYPCQQSEQRFNPKVVKSMQEAADAGSVMESSQWRHSPVDWQIEQPLLLGFVK